MNKLIGFTLLEVLIAVLVLSLGLLGLASLQIVSLKSISSALYRIQATNLSYFIIDNMRANQLNAINGSYNVNLTSVPICTTTATTVSGTVAQQDVAIWQNLLACLLPSGTGSITLSGNTVTITIQWDGSHDVSATDSTVAFTMVTNL